MDDLMREVFWAMLPEGLQEFFELETFSKTDSNFRIILKEKNNISSDLPEAYSGRRVTDTTLNNFLMDDFPIRGRKGEILLKRRSWKFEGIDKWFTRDLTSCAKGTKLEKEFADFLKEMDRD